MYNENFFNYRSFDEEIIQKKLSHSFDTDSYFFTFLEDLKRNNICDCSNIEKFNFKIKEIFLTEPYPKYMHHPYRLAISYVKEIANPNEDDVIFALSHNSMELCIHEKIGISKILLEKVNILTIDRKREKDKIYRKEFYDAIESYSTDLMLFKALDKLDNTLSWVYLDFETYHIDVVLEEVCPRTKKNNPKLSEYLEKLVIYTTNSEIKKKYRG
jgi:hypothetical protein